MVNIADSYFEAIEHADGKLAPFCRRLRAPRNGGQTTHNAKPVPWPVPLGSKQADDAMAYLGTLSCSVSTGHARHGLHHAALAAAARNRRRRARRGFFVPDVQPSRRHGLGEDLQRPGVGQSAARRLLVQHAGGASCSRSIAAASSRWKPWARSCRTARRAAGASSQPTAFFTSARMRVSSAGVSFFSA